MSMYTYEYCVFQSVLNIPISVSTAAQHSASNKSNFIK